MRMDQFTIKAQEAIAASREIADELGHPQDAADAVQDTFVRAMRAIGG